MIPLAAPYIAGNEWRYIKECLDSGWVSSVGKYVDRFEADIARHVGAKYAVATVNGTSALHIALIVCGIKPDDEVIVPTLTFIAPANAVRYVGAWPLFIDIEPAYLQLSVPKLEEFFQNSCKWKGGQLINKKSGRNIRAILPVHHLGHPVDMRPLKRLALKYHLKIIEDATEALGAEYRGKKTSTLGEIGCFSFNGNKIITTGGGGMIVTNDARLASKAKYLTTQAKKSGDEYIHTEIGYNYRLTNLQAAMGCAQLEKLPQYIESKRRIARVYGENLNGVPGVKIMAEADWARSIFWMYTILLDQSRFGRSSRELKQLLKQKGIQTRPLWQPLNRSAVFPGQKHEKCPNALRAYRDALSLPSSVNLKNSDILMICQLIKKAVRD